MNFMKCNGKSKSAQIFRKVCEKINAENVTLLLHAEVRWLSRDKVKMGNSGSRGTAKP